RGTTRRVKQGAPPPTVFPRGSLTIRFDREDGRLVSLDGSEGETVRLEKKKIGHGQATVRVGFLRRESVPEDELWKLRLAGRSGDGTALPLSAPDSEEAHRASIARNELGKTTLEELLADLARVEGSAIEESLKNRLYFKMKAYCY